jgi:ABC-2 type transport system permease protein
MRSTFLSFRSQLKIFSALIERDLAVLRQEMAPFMVRIFLLPFLYTFVFAGIFPRIGRSIGDDFLSVLLPGLMASTLTFQGLSAVAVPLVMEFDTIEDRVMAPVPLEIVGLAKVAGATIQAVFAALLIVPVVLLTGFIWGDHAQVSWQQPLQLLSITVLSAVVSSALGLVIGVSVSERRVKYFLPLLITPLTLLGCVFFRWTDLESIPSFQKLVLLNPVVYISEGLRSAIAPEHHHLPLSAVYGVLVLSGSIALWIGLNRFKAHVSK